jgi:hypothetical protein
MMARAPAELPAAGLRNLVLVAGHAVFTGVDFHAADQESSWFLEEYQQIPGGARVSDTARLPPHARRCTNTPS